jgi:hypothetical protein
MKKLKGGLTVTRVTPWGGDSAVPERIKVIVMDEPSGLPVMTLYADPAAFSRALTGLSGVPCSVELNTATELGCVREVKQVEITVDRAADLRNKKSARTLIAAHEGDGWTGHADDLHNMHNWTYHSNGRVTASVTYTRWVPTPAETP